MWWEKSRNGRKSVLSGLLQVCKTSDIMPTFVNNGSQASVFFPENHENDRERRMTAKSVKVAWSPGLKIRSSKRNSIDRSGPRQRQHLGVDRTEGQCSGSNVSKEEEQRNGLNSS